MPNHSSYPTTKTYEGWFQHAQDYEYGPTLIRYTGREKGGTPYPIKDAETKCEYLADPKWEEVWIVPERYGGKAWRAKITVEIYEERDTKVKEEW